MVDQRCAAKLIDHPCRSFRRECDRLAFIRHDVPPVFAGASGRLSRRSVVVRPLSADWRRFEPEFGRRRRDHRWAEARWQYEDRPAIEVDTDVVRSHVSYRTQDFAHLYNGPCRAKLGGGTWFRTPASALLFLKS